jgi:hypothetical protein
MRTVQVIRPDQDGKVESRISEVGSCDVRLNVNASGIGGSDASALAASSSEHVLPRMEGQAVTTLDEPKPFGRTSLRDVATNIVVMLGLALLAAVPNLLTAVAMTIVSRLFGL